MLIRHLPADSALVQALNEGRPQWTAVEHLLADLWVLIAQVNSPRNKGPKDHPRRIALEARSRAAAKSARLAELKAEYDERKRKRRSRLSPEEVR